MSSASLSLYQIESQLLELMAWRDNPELTDEERATADAEIRKYVAAEISKADGVANYLKECDSRAELPKAEASRIAERAKAWQKRGERLTDLVISVMQHAGKTEIEGRTSTLKLVKNPPSVEISQPELLPAEYARVSVQMNAKLWNTIKEAHRSGATLTLADALDKALSVAKVSEPEPSKPMIAAVLKADVGVPGARLNCDGVRLKVS